MAEGKILDHVIKSLARLFLPDLLEYYSTKEGNAEFEKQKREQGVKTLLPKG